MRPKSISLKVDKAMECIYQIMMSNLPQSKCHNWELCHGNLNAPITNNTHLVQNIQIATKRLPKVWQKNRQKANYKQIKLISVQCQREPDK